MTTLNYFMTKEKIMENLLLITEFATYKFKYFTTRELYVSWHGDGTVSMDMNNFMLTLEAWNNKMAETLVWINILIVLLAAVMIITVILVFLLDAKKIQVNKLKAELDELKKERTLP